jgi:hypothetical protein
MGGFQNSLSIFGIASEIDTTIKNRRYRPIHFLNLRLKCKIEKARHYNMIA